MMTSLDSAHSRESGNPVKRNLTAYGKVWVPASAGTSGI